MIAPTGYGQAMWNNLLRTQADQFADGESVRAAGPADGQRAASSAKSGATPGEFFETKFSAPSDRPELPRDKAADAALPADQARERMLKRIGAEKCETCENRTYQDVSDDPGVSFKSPTSVAPQAAASAVAAHENQHVSHEGAKARAEGRRVVYQRVQMHTNVCPECGKVYVSGGTTTTATAGKGDLPQASAAKSPDESAAIDLKA